MPHHQIDTASPSDVGFDLGQYYEEGMHRKPPNGASSEEMVAYMWGPMCSQNKVSVPCPVKPGERIPYLKAWEDSTDREYFTVYMPGVLDTRIEYLVGAIRSMRPGAQDVSSKEMEDPGWFKICVSKYKLPDEEPWLDEYMPAETHRTALGRLASGPIAIWDWRKDVHKIIVGATGQGKTTEARIILMQLALRGGIGIVMTPKPQDVNLEPFSVVPGWQVITNSTEEAYEAKAKQAMWIQKEFRHRMSNLNGREYTTAPPIVWLIDELGYEIAPKAGDSAEMKANKAIIVNAFLEIAEQGRQADVHIVGMVQTPAVKNMGGDQSIVNQMSSRSAIGSLKSAAFQALLFPLDGPEQKKIVKRVLSSANPKPGRAIVIGVQPHDGDEFADVDRAMMQGFWIEVDEMVEKLETIEGVESRTPPADDNQQSPATDSGLPSFFSESEPEMDVRPTYDTEEEIVEAELITDDESTPRGVKDWTDEELEAEFEGIAEQLAEPTPAASYGEPQLNSRPIRNALFLFALVVQFTFGALVIVTGSGSLGIALALSIIPFVIFPLFGLDHLRAKRNMPPPKVSPVRFAVWAMIALSMFAVVSAVTG